jgi:hypothetical protein
MMNGSMMLCMIAAALFDLIIVIAVIVQAVLQANILREVRRLKTEHASDEQHAAIGFGRRSPA